MKVMGEETPERSQQQEVRYQLRGQEYAWLGRQLGWAKVPEGDGMLGDGDGHCAAQENAQQHGSKS
jgi:hypothetical protein